MIETATKRDPEVREEPVAPDREAIIKAMFSWMESIGEVMPDVHVVQSLTCNAWFDSDAQSELQCVDVAAIKQSADRTWQKLSDINESITDAWRALRGDQERRKREAKEAHVADLIDRGRTPEALIVAESA